MAKRTAVAIQADGTIRVVEWDAALWCIESTGDYRRPRRRFRCVTARRPDDDAGPGETTLVWLECALEGDPRD